MANPSSQGVEAAAPRGIRKFGAVGAALGPFLALSAVIAFFLAGEFVREWRASGRPLGAFASTYRSTFASGRNIRTTTVQTVTVATAALGMTVVIIAGGIDLSAGSAVALCSVVLAVLLKGGWPAPVAVLACLLAGCSTGLIHGLLISTLRVVPFIVTLGTMMMYLGVAKWISKETTVAPDPDRQVPLWLRNLLTVQEGAPGLLGLPFGVWALAALALLLAAVLRYSVFSRHVFAVGSNEATARLCGINVPLTKAVAYTLAGLFVGVAGLMHFSRLTQGNPTSGSGMELRIIAAVVIGGGSLSGGRGGVLGTIVGAAIMSVLGSGSTILEWSQPLQDVMIGTIIVAAVTLDQFRQRRQAA